MAILPARKSSLKRKHSSNSKLLSRKKQRKEVNSFNDLPWRTVSRPNGTGFEGDDGVLELEEVDGVEVVYEETENGRIAKLKVIAEEDDVLSLKEEEEKDDDGSSEADEAEAPATNESEEEESKDDGFDGELLMRLYSRSYLVNTQSSYDFATKLVSLPSSSSLALRRTRSKLHNTYAHPICSSSACIKRKGRYWRCTNCEPSCTYMLKHTACSSCSTKCILRCNRDPERLWHTAFRSCTMSYLISLRARLRKSKSVESRRSSLHPRASSHCKLPRI